MEIKKAEETIFFCFWHFTLICASLNTGGKIIVTTPAKELSEHLQYAQENNGRYALYLHYRDIPEPWNGYSWNDAHNYLYLAKELAQLFHECGFKIKEIYPFRKGKYTYLVAEK